MNRHIPWFNPREMRDEVLLALNTGRAAVLQEILRAIVQRSLHPGHINHYLMTGTRGAGKSFFLRLLQATLQRQPIANVRFVLLPEELPNIFAPHELLQEILRMLNPEKNPGQVAQWKVDDTGGLWDSALSKLLAAVPEGLLVVGIENFDQLIANAFANEVDNSRLRHLMSNQPRIMFIATAVLGDFDENHEQRLFRQFEHRKLPAWTPQDHRTYLTLRAEQQGKTASNKQLARIDAYSRYTGGNPRAAAILAATILEEDDLIAGAEGLDASIEKMSDYYRALIDRIPNNTKKLFDALIRGGEPASQTDIAQRTAAKQSEISRAFSWLLDNGYVNESREAGQKTKQYRVVDRLLVQFYRMRYLQPGQRSRLAVMAELLADMLSFQDKWQYADLFAKREQPAEAQTLADLALQERGVNVELLPSDKRDAQSLLAERAMWGLHDAINAWSLFTNGFSLAEQIETMLRQFPDDAAMSAAIEHVTRMVSAATCWEMCGAYIVNLLDKSLLPPIQKYLLLSMMIDGVQREEKWKLVNEFCHAQLPGTIAIGESESGMTEQDRKLRFRRKHFPRTFSLHAVWEMQVVKLPAFVSATWASKAALGWLQGGDLEAFESALGWYFSACQESSHTEYSPKELLETFKHLLSIEENLEISDRAIFRYLHGIVLVCDNQIGPAYEMFDAAQADMYLSIQQIGRIARTGADLMTTVGYCQGLVAWCQAELGDVEKALKSHCLVIEYAKHAGCLELLALSQGQYARLRLRQVAFDVVWQELTLAMRELPGLEASALKQLGDAVVDVNKKSGRAAAFGLGLEILQALSQHPEYPSDTVLHGLWIDMVQENVEFGVLQDLLGEWDRLWPQNVDVLGLSNVLQLWIKDLQSSPEEKEALHKTYDPDLVTTLKALTEALSPKARHRLGLLAPVETQVPS